MKSLYVVTYGRSGSTLFTGYLSKLPGNMPALKTVKMVKYDEEGWTARRTETLEKIKELVQETR